MSVKKPKKKADIPPKAPGSKFVTKKAKVGKKVKPTKGTGY